MSPPLEARGEAHEKLCVYLQISSWMASKLQPKCFFQWIFETVARYISNLNIAEKTQHFTGKTASTIYLDVMLYFFFANDATYF